MNRTSVFPCRLLRVVLAFAAVLLPAIEAHAGSQRPIDDPAVFEGAMVNSFVLPYRYVGPNPTDELQRSSRQIAGLVHFHVLFTMLKYGAVGGTDLLAKPGQDYDVDDVIAKVTRVPGPGSLPAGRALVVVWGRLYEDGSDLYVQSYVRFLRQGRERPSPEAISVALAGGGEKLELSATLPTQSIAFPPRKISKEDLAAIDREFRKSLVVHTEPRMDSPGTPIDFGPDKLFPYGVTRTEGDWMYIRPLRPGPAGWVRAVIGDQEGSFSVRRWMPELAFVNGIAGFMRLQARDGSAGGGKVAPNRAAMFRDWIDAAFARFESAVPAEDAGPAYGLARAVRGFVLWEQGTSAARAEAARLFAEARALMPDYAAARTLAAVTQPLIGGNDGKLDAAACDRLGKELLGAIAIDPGQSESLANLEQLYGLFIRKPAWSRYAAGDLSTRIGVVRAARTASLRPQ